MTTLITDIPETAAAATEQLFPVPTPYELAREFPVSSAVLESVEGHRRAVRRIVHGYDSRMLAIVGPCSIHDPEAADEYAARLGELSHSLSQSLLIVMRVYIDKPRTTTGWRGLLLDPDLDGSGDVVHGLRCSRALLRQIANRGVPVATEILDPTVPGYLGDLVSWAAIGARTSESQTHRDLAAALAMPVGFKNGTHGDTQIAINAVVAARTPTVKLGLSGHGRTIGQRIAGNPDTHLILRGGADGCNYSAASVRLVAEQSRLVGIRSGIVVDCSHGNSGKTAALQPRALKSVIASRATAALPVAGFMLEGNLFPGKQEPGQRPLRYGVSVTDDCLGWTETEDLLRSAAHVLQQSELPRRRSA